MAIMCINYFIINIKKGTAQTGQPFVFHATSRFSKFSEASEFSDISENAKGIRWRFISF